MSYQISSIKDRIPSSGTKYLLDTNVWYYILEGTSKDYQGVYLDFFDAIKNFSGSPKPKVVLPTTVLSEIINRLLRDIRFREFKDNPDNLEKIAGIEERRIYKDVYRNDEQFRIDYRSICNDIKSFHYILEFVGDEFETFRIKDILSNPPLNLDFNDFIITKIAKKNNFTIVTDDADFLVEDINIVTANNKLIKKSTNL